MADSSALIRFSYLSASGLRQLIYFAIKNELFIVFVVIIGCVRRGDTEARRRLPLLRVATISRRNVRGDGIVVLSLIVADLSFMRRENPHCCRVNYHFRCNKLPLIIINLQDSCYLYGTFLFYHIIN